MSSVLIVVLFLAAAIAVAGWASRAGLARQLSDVRAEAAEAISAADEARREAEKRAEERRGRAEELHDVREKLKDAKKRLHDAQEESKKARDLASARAHEVREVEHQVAQVREDAARISDELRRAKEEVSSPRRRPERREEAPRPAPVAVQYTPPPPPTPAEIDERVARLEKELAAENERTGQADRKMVEVRKQLDEAQAELKRTRGRAEANHRVYLVSKGEADIWKDKFAALEAKWNDLWRELEGIGWKSRVTREEPARRGKGRPGSPRGEAPAAAAAPSGPPASEVPEAPEAAAGGEEQPAEPSGASEA